MHLKGNSFVHICERRPPLGTDLTLIGLNLVALKRHDNDGTLQKLTVKESPMKQCEKAMDFRPNYKDICGSSNIKQPETRSGNKGAALVFTEGDNKPPCLLGILGSYLRNLQYTLYMDATAKKKWIEDQLEHF